MMERYPQAMKIPLRPPSSKGDDYSSLSPAAPAPARRAKGGAAFQSQTMAPDGWEGFEKLYSLSNAPCPEGTLEL